MEIEVEKLPKVLRKKGLEEKLAKICRENDIVFFAVFGSFVRGQQNRRRKVDLGIFSSLNPYLVDDVKREMRVIYEKVL
jgi:predicted nucleotidyltransferase